MNAVVVARAATGFGEHLVASCDDAPRVVLAHDARHRSAAFARVAARRLTALGVRVEQFDAPVPTPLAAFALRDRGADGALVVTASHNPATDNGLKVYGADGAQIISPTDREIAERIRRVPLDVDLRVGVEATTSDAGPAPVVLGGASSERSPVPEYLRAATGVTAGRRWSPLRVAVTALHGVGADLLDRAVGAMEGIEVHHVAGQRHPDPDFPTVADPNPEHPATLAALLELADAVDADVALALDPDADRLAVALPDAEGGWRPLSGDQTGAVLAADLLAHSTSGPTDRPRLVATTIVSSRLVPAMCAAAGVHHVETLTGFKWLCRPGLAHPQWHQLLLYEEALGYVVGPHARDKDGITAALAMLVAVGTQRLAGRSPWHVLDDLATAHGAHVQRNGSVRRRSDAAHVDVLLGQLTATTALGGLAVRGVDRPAHDIVRMELEDRTRVIVRPSGTEPKVKHYVEAIEPVEPVDAIGTVEASDGGPAAARARATARLAPVVDELVARLSS
jgi:phosphomannomutase